MPLTVYFQDPREETRRRIFLDLVTAQCLSAPGQVHDECRDILEDLQVRARIVFRNLDREPDQIQGIFQRLFDEYAHVRKNTPSKTITAIKPAVRRTLRRLIALRRGKDVDNGYEWQSPVPGECIDPNPVLEWYLQEIVPVVEHIEMTYQRALRRPFDVHVNLVLLPKDQDEGPTNGVTLRRKTDARFNPCPDSRAPGRVVRVELRLPRVFDEVTAFMIPYTVAHEFGVHTMQQLELINGPKAEEGKWLFSEGFMDAVITDLLADFLNSLQTEHPFHISRRRAAHRRHRTRLIEELPSSAQAMRTAWETQLIDGAHCWKRLLEIAGLAGENTLGVPPRQWAFDVAFKLNSLPLEVDVRDRFLMGFESSFAYFSNGTSLPGTDEVRFLATTAGSKAHRQHPFDRFYQTFRHIHEVDDPGVLSEVVESLVNDIVECAPDFLSC